jgi:hypothetical protein
LFESYLLILTSLTTTNQKLPELFSCNPPTDGVIFTFGAAANVICRPLGITKVRGRQGGGKKLDGKIKVFSFDLKRRMRHKCFTVAETVPH